MDMGDEDLGAPPIDDKPFDDEPFDAGVEADETEDPKQYIQQLAGKIGQSLRKYEKDIGDPDFELEKFVVNSVLSATNTGEMDKEDQKDIITKVKTSGLENGGGDDVDVNIDTDGGDENIDVNVDEPSGGEDIDLEEGAVGDLNISDEISNFVSDIESHMDETVGIVNRDDMNTETPAIEPEVKPDVVPEKPKRRKDSPFTPPHTQPKPRPKAG